MTDFAQMAQDYISQSEKILEKKTELEQQLKSVRMTATDQRALRKRINLLDAMYRDTRATGRQLRREYGS